MAGQEFILNAARSLGTASVFQREYALGWRLSEKKAREGGLPGIQEVVTLLGPESQCLESEAETTLHYDYKLQPPPASPEEKGNKVPAEFGFRRSDGGMIRARIALGRVKLVLDVEPPPKRDAK